MEAIDNFCAITEGSNNTFPMTRNAIASFIKTNKWFNGTLIVLTLKSDPLSEHNTNIINILYPDNKIIKINDSEIKELINKTKKTNGVFDPIDLLYLYSFKIKSNGNLYFNRNTCFLKEISELLSDNKISVVSYEKSLTPNINQDRPVDNRLIFIPSNYINDKSYKSLYGHVLESNFSILNPSILPFNEFISELSVTKLPNIYLTRSSFFPNNKYSIFVRYNKSVHSVLLDTLMLNSNDYSRMHLYWQHFNKISDNQIKNPRLNRNEMIKHVPSFKLNSNVGHTLSSVNTAICTICDDKFTPGLITMLYSFLKHNPWFNKEVIVLYDDVYSPISESNRSLINNVYNNVVFKPVIRTDYEQLISVFKKNAKGRENVLRLIPSLFTFEIFSVCAQYDTLVYLDSDMIIRKDISELFNMKESIVVTPDAGVYDLNKHVRTFNGGFMVLNGGNDLVKHKMGLINYANSMRTMVLADQTIMNSYFAKHKLTYLDSRYNCLKRCFSDGNFNKFDDNIKIVHYVGAKPWIPSKLAMEAKYKKIENLWHVLYAESKTTHTKIGKSFHSSKKAVFIHLFYQDLWPEIKNKLRSIPFEYDLYVSICSDHIDEISNDIKTFNNTSTIVRVENRGADYGGFFELLNKSFDMNKEYDWVLKIHGKKSLLINPRSGENWRKAAISALIPNNFDHINKAFNDRSTGMIGPKKYLMSASSWDKRARKNVNGENIDYFRNRYDVTDNILYFFAGSMFWVKYSILKSTFNNDRINQYDFDEGHATDGTKAHAMERFLANIVRDSKNNLLGI
jgi:lipopolysaccharide biosynthesis glycosyltransferase